MGALAPMAPMLPMPFPQLPLFLFQPVCWLKAGHSSITNSAMLALLAVYIDFNSFASVFATHVTAMYLCTYEVIAICGDILCLAMLFLQLGCFYMGLITQAYSCNVLIYVRMYVYVPTYVDSSDGKGSY